MVNTLESKFSRVLSPVHVTGTFTPKASRYETLSAPQVREVPVTLSRLFCFQCSKRPADLAGNVNEWTGSLYQPYPYTLATHEDLTAHAPRVIRGGSWYEAPEQACCTRRTGSAPLRKSRYVGFRLACGPAPL
jgi:Sulfatase-modifying factor enzyme 1